MRQAALCALVLFLGFTAPISAGKLALLSVSCPSSLVAGGPSGEGTVTLTAPAPAGGIVVELSTYGSAVVTVPPTVTVAEGETSAVFAVTPGLPGIETVVALYEGATQECFVSVRPAPDRTFVIPHVVELPGGEWMPAPGGAGSTTSDFVISVVNAGGLAGFDDHGTVIADIYLFQRSGEPMRAVTSNDICNPCTASVVPGSRFARSVEEFAVIQGGFVPAMGTGYAVVDIYGGGDAVAVGATLRHYAASGSGLAVMGVVPQDLREAGAALVPARTIVPEFWQSANGSLTANIDFALPRGHAGVPAGSTALLHVDLFTDTGASIPTLGGPLCPGSCQFLVGSLDDAGTANVGDLILAHGGFESPVVTGFAIFRVTGDGAANVVSTFRQIAASGSRPPGDLNGDGVADGLDLFFFANWWFGGGPPPLVP